MVRLCLAAGFEPHVTFETDDYETVQGLVAAGVGVALIPRLALDPGPLRGSSSARSRHAARLAKGRGRHGAGPGARPGGERCIRDPRRRGRALPRGLSPHDHEPRRGVQHLATAELLHQLAGVEVALVDLEARAVVQFALLPLLPLVIGAHGAVGDDQLRRDPARVGEEALAIAPARWP